MPTTTKQVRVPSVKTLMRGIITPDGFEREETTDSYRWGDNTNTWPVLILRSPDTEIRIDFDAETGPRRRESYMLAHGHVSFDTPLGCRTFDRTGVEDSFYIDNPVKDYDRLWTGDRVQHGRTGAKGTVTDPGYERGEKVRPIMITWDGEPPLEVPYSDRQLQKDGIKKSDVMDRTNHRIRNIIEKRIPEARERLAQSERVPQLPFTVTPETKAAIRDKLQKGGQHTFMPSGFGTGYTLTARRPRRSDAETSTVLARYFGVRMVWITKFDAD